MIYEVKDEDCNIDYILRVVQDPETKRLSLEKIQVDNTLLEEEYQEVLSKMRVLCGYFYNPRKRMEASSLHEDLLKMPIVAKEVSIKKSKTLPGTIIGVQGLSRMPEFGVFEENLRLLVELEEYIQEHFLDLDHPNINFTPGARYGVGYSRVFSGDRGVRPLVNKEMAQELYAWFEAEVKKLKELEVNGLDLYYPDQLEQFFGCLNYRLSEYLNRFLYPRQQRVLNFDNNDYDENFPDRYEQLRYSLADYRYRKALENNPHEYIVAKSHSEGGNRGVGDGLDKQEFGDELEVAIRTNFGFGGQAYFHVILKYRGVMLYSYSEWLRAYRSYYKTPEGGIKFSYSEFKRATRSYDLVAKSWNKALGFVVDTYNWYLEKPQEFDKEFVIKEVELMLKEFEEELTAPKCVVYPAISIPTASPSPEEGEEEEEAVERIYQEVDVNLWIVYMVKFVLGSLKEIEALPQEMRAEISSSIEKVRLLALEKLEVIKRLEQHPLWQIGVQLYDGYKQMLQYVASSYEQLKRQREQYSEETDEAKVLAKRISSVEQQIQYYEEWLESFSFPTQPFNYNPLKPSYMSVEATLIFLSNVQKFLEEEGLVARPSEQNSHIQDAE